MRAVFWTQNWINIADPNWVCILGSELGSYSGPRIGSVFWTKNWVRILDPELASFFCLRGGGIGVAKLGDFLAPLCVRLSLLYLIGFVFLGQVVIRIARRSQRGSGGISTTLQSRMASKS